MNKLFSHVVILFAAALSLTSCLSDNDESETTYYTDTAISSFSLGTLNITYHTTASDGVTDSTYKSTFSASSYAFDIDQQKGTIANEDSLPVGTDAAHCLATINTVNSGTVLLVLTSSTGADSLAYYSSSDSIDFTSPVRLRVYNMEGSAYRNYIVTVNVHKQKENQFSWQEGTFDISSLVQHEDGVIGKTNKYRYAIIGSRLMRSPIAGGTWTVEKLDEDSSLLPTKDINFIVAPMASDTTLYNIFLIGSRDGKVVRWSKVEDDDDASQVWTYYDDDEYVKKTLPYLANMKAVLYGDSIIATGGDFSAVYTSPDWGLTWNKSSLFALPTAFGNTPGAFEMAVDKNNILYIKRDDASTGWYGRLSQLGWSDEQRVFTKAKAWRRIKE